MKENIRTGIFWKLSSEISSYFLLCLTAGILTAVLGSLLVLYAPAGQEALLGLAQYMLTWTLVFGGIYTAVYSGGALLERPAAAAAGTALLAAVLGFTLSDMVPQAAGTQEVRDGLADLVTAAAGTEVLSMPEPALLFGAGTLAVSALVLLLLHMAIAHSVWTEVLYMIAADTLLVILSARGMDIGKGTAVLAVMMTILCARRLCDAQYLRWMGQLCVLGAVCLFMPVSSRPIDWSVLQRISQRIQDGVGSMVADTGYLLSGLGSGDGYESGYTGLGTLGGSVGQSGREELYLEGGKARGPVYLKGTMHTAFQENDGVTAGLQAEELQGRWLLNYLSALYRCDVTREEAKLFGYTHEYRIEFGYLRTDDIIHPQHLLRVSLDPEALSPDGSAFSRIRGKGTNYTATFMEVDYGSPYLEGILRQQQEPAAYPSYETLRDYARTTYDLQLNLYVTEMEYNRWTDHGRNPLPVPDAVFSDPGETSARMKELAAQLTEGIETDYDKCRAIEAFLRQYTYNRNPQTADDLVEDFLFGTKEGYCIHFTSAMVTLLRLNGIPARCAEGYVCTVPGRSSEPYIVTGSRAHAWPEAYIRGFGWVPFEPTPGRATSLASTWNLFLPGDMPEQAGGYAGNIVPAPAAIPGGAAQTAPGEDTADDTVGYPVGQILFSLLRTAVLAAAALLVYCAVSVTALYLIRRRRFARFDDNSQMTVLMEDIRWLILRRAGRRDSKAAAALAAGDYPGLLPAQEDLQPAFAGQEIQPLAVHVFETWNALRFGGKDVSHQDLADTRKLHLILRRIVDMPGQDGKRKREPFRRLWSRLEMLLHLKAFF